MDYPVCEFGHPYCPVDEHYRSSVADLRARLAACEKERDEARRRHSEAVEQIACRNELRAQVAEARAALDKERGSEANAARIAAALDEVQRPSLIPVGAPGSVMRRAWDLGRERDAAVARAEKAERDVGGWTQMAQDNAAKAIELGAALDAERARAETFRECEDIRRRERDAARAEAAALRSALQSLRGWLTGSRCNDCEPTRHPGDFYEHEPECGALAALKAAEAALSGDAGRALLDEVRGLREADAECQRQHETSKQEGADATRASIVAWIRAHANERQVTEDEPLYSPECRGVLLMLADAIERREDEKR